MLPTSLAVPLRLAYCDGTSPFALEATVTALGGGDDPTGQGPVTVTLGTGTLHDADKGRFALDGLGLCLRYVDGRFEPGHLLPPHELSEFQQAGLLDAVASALSALATQPSATPVFPDIVTALQSDAALQPDAERFVFLRDGEQDAVSITAGELDRRARAVASALAARVASGSRVMIVLPPGLDYVVAVLGALYAGIVAVPAYPPVRAKDVERLEAMAADCAPSLVVTTPRAGRAAEGGFAPACPVVEFTALEAMGGDPLADAPRRPTDLAFLQYTSGSTGRPRGAAITHGNLSYNSWLISLARAHRRYTTVCWLPPFHDMGLIGVLFQTIFTGSHSVLMSPAHFLQRPSRWLRALSDRRCTGAAAPDFAFRLCADRIDEAECAGLDLSALATVVTGAEPVRHDTIERFVARFSRYGFRRDAFVPCYGLAEASLYVTGKPVGTPTRTIWVDREALAEGRVVATDAGQDAARPVVSSGRPLGDTTVSIVNPDTGRPLPEGSIGEIWTAGTSVAAGYFGRDPGDPPFGRRVDGDERPYLATGDLGFIDGGDLFVTGRMKGLIVVRGRNVHAEDVEATVADALHGVVDVAGAAAFPVEHAGQEAIGVCLELAGRPPRGFVDWAAAFEQARARVVNAHGVGPALLAVVGLGSLPRTSSGKPRRHLCLDALGDPATKVLARWEAP